MATNSERAQPIRRSATELSRALAAARETPQARRDPTVENRAFMEQYQAAFSPYKAGNVTGLPRGPQSPANGNCGLLTSNDIVDLSWDEIGRELAVASLNNVDILRQDGIYWERVGQIPVASPIVAVSLHNGGLWLGTNGGGQYMPNWRVTGEMYLLRALKPVDGIATSTVVDTNPDWIDEVTASYQTEPVPAGAYRGNYATLADAINDGATVGDWYHDTTADAWYEITGVGPSSANLMSYSEQFENSYWTKTRADLTPDVITAPDGTLTADLATCNETNAGGSYVWSTTPQATTGSDYVTTAVYLKAGTVDVARLQIIDPTLTNGARTEFDLGSGKVGSSQSFGTGYTVVDCSITPAGDGWFRCVCAVAKPNAEDSVSQFYMTGITPGDNTIGDSMYLWGAQVVVGTFEPDQEIARWNFNEPTVPRLLLDNFGGNATQILADTFTSGLNGWSGVGAIVSLVNGAMSVDNDGAVSGSARKAFEATAGKTYRVKVDLTDTTSSPLALVRIRNAALSVVADTPSSNDPTSYEFVFTAATTETHYIDCANGSSADASVSTWDNIFIDELAEPANNWTPGADTNQWVVNGRFVFQKADASGGTCRTFLPLTFETGEWYSACFENWGGASGNVAISPDSTLGNAIASANINSALPFIEFFFNAPQTSLNTLMTGSSTEDETSSINTVRVQRAPALDGWYVPVTFPDAAISVDASRIKVEATDGVLAGRAATGVTLTADEYYLLTYDSEPSPGCTFAVSSSDDLGSSYYTQSLNSGGSYSAVIQAQAAQTYLGFINDPLSTAIADDIVLSTAKAVIPVYSATTDADAGTQIYRAGSANFPRSHVAEAVTDEVVIYDTSVTPPEMWMVFEVVNGYMIGDAANTNSAITSGEGRTYVGKVDLGLQEIDFVGDTGYRFRAPGAFTTKGSWPADIASRNTAQTWGAEQTREVVSDVVNDTAATALDSVETTNLLSQTENLDQPPWELVGNLLVRPNVRVAPDGTQTADEIYNGVTGSDLLQQEITLEAVEYVVSVYFTKDSANKSGATLDLFASGLVGSSPRVFWRGETQEFAVVEALDAGSEDVGGGWMRCWYRFQGEAVAVRFRAACNNCEAVLWGWQLEKSSNVHDYVPSVTAPTTGNTASAKQYVNQDIGGGVIQTTDTGLRIPTWAATTGTANADGLGSVGLDTGEVADYLQGANHGIEVDFTTNGDLLWTYSASSLISRIPVKSGGSTGVSTDPDSRNWSVGTVPAIAENAGKKLAAMGTNAWSFNERDVTSVTPLGLGILLDGGEQADEAVYTKITEDYNTGPMFKVAGAWANDDSSAPIGFAYTLFEDFDTPNGVRFEDRFERNGISPWGLPDPSRDGAYMDRGELFNFKVTGGGNNPRVTTRVDIPVGKWYRLVGDYRNVSSDGLLGVANNSNGASAYATSGIVTTSGTYELTFQSEANPSWLVLSAQTTVDGGTAAFDNVILEEVLALEGWETQNDASLSIKNGTICVKNEGILRGDASKLIPTTLSANYVVNATQINGAGAGRVVVGTTQGGAELGGGNPGPDETVTFSFVGTGSPVYLSVSTNTPSTGAERCYDNITVQESLVADSTFDVATLPDWTLGTGWADGTGVAVKTAGTNSNISQALASPPAVGTLITVQAELVSRTAGVISFPQTLTDATRVSPFESYSVPGTYSAVYEITGPAPNIAVNGDAAFAGEIDNVFATEALPDNSGQENHAQVIGQVTRTQFNRCTFGVCTDENNYVRIQGTAGDELQGWYRINGNSQPWYLFETASDVPFIEKDGNDYLLKSACYAHLMLSSEPVPISSFDDSFNESFST